jgi:hypothetical protein
MEVTALDRVVFFARDYDKAIELFSRKFGMEFKELSKEISEKIRVRCALCSRVGIHLISPVFPVLENAPPLLKKIENLLKEQEMIIASLTFKTDNLEKTGHLIEQEGLKVVHRYNKTNDYITLGMEDFEEIVLDIEDTMGFTFAFSKYNRIP